MMDGRPGLLACRTLAKNLKAEISLAPLPGFELIADLSVNTRKWMRGMGLNKSRASVSIPVIDGVMKIFTN
jgi:succinate dehydrogenase/fumarate reductase-like Fe-S protein